MTEYVAHSGLRLWLCEVMTRAHPSDKAVTARVQASLAEEKNMADIVRETRQAQEDAGVQLRECSIDAQLRIVLGSSRPCQSYTLYRRRCTDVQLLVVHTTTQS